MSIKLTTSIKEIFALIADSVKNGITIITFCMVYAAYYQKGCWISLLHSNLLLLTLLAILYIIIIERVHIKWALLMPGGGSDTIGPKCWQWWFGFYLKVMVYKLTIGFPESGRKATICSFSTKMICYIGIIIIKSHIWVCVGDISNVKYSIILFVFLFCLFSYRSHTLW